MLKREIPTPETLQLHNQGQSLLALVGKITYPQGGEMRKWWAEPLLALVGIITYPQGGKTRKWWSAAEVTGLGRNSWTRPGIIKKDSEAGECSSFLTPETWTEPALEARLCSVCMHVPLGSRLQWDMVQGFKQRPALYMSS